MVLVWSGGENWALELVWRALPEQSVISMSCPARLVQLACSVLFCFVDSSRVPPSLVRWPCAQAVDPLSTTDNMLRKLPYVTTKLWAPVWLLENRPAVYGCVCWQRVPYGVRKQRVRGTKRRDNIPKLRVPLLPGGGMLW